MHQRRGPVDWEFELGWGDAVLHPGDEIGAVIIDSWVDLFEVRNIAPGCNAVASVASLRHEHWEAVGTRAGGEGRLSGVCTCAGGTALGWTERRIKRSTLWCGEADVSTEEQLRAIALERRVECVEIRRG